jgi:hypothetical protein
VIAVAESDLGGAVAGDVDAPIRRVSVASAAAWRATVGESYRRSGPDMKRVENPRSSAWTANPAQAAASGAELSWTPKRNGRAWTI